MNLDFHSLSRVCNNSSQVMIYGWGSCKFFEVVKELKKDDSPIKQIFNFMLGASPTELTKENCSIKQIFDELLKGDPTLHLYTTLEGSAITQMAVEPTNDNPLLLKRICKAAINNLVWENYKRRQQDLLIIPLIFCYDIDGKKRVVTPANIAERHDTKVITHSELRRCYKLCCEIEKDSILAPIARVAKETIKFVKLVGTETSGYQVKQLTPFWETKEWRKAWKARQLSKNLSSNAKINQWREQLKAELISYNLYLNVGLFNF